MKGETLGGLTSAGGNTTKEKANVSFVSSNRNVEIEKEERKGVGRGLNHRAELSGL